jgi:protein-tyrosine phosphatase
VVRSPAVSQSCLGGAPGEWLEDEVARWRAERVNVVVSLLDPAEIRELGLNDESALCGERGMQFVSFPVPDRGVPDSLRATAELVAHLARRLESGSSIAIHCRAGIGRSALVAACVLVRTGVAVDAAFESIAAARRLPVPDTDEQRAWVHCFRDEGR